MDTQPKETEILEDKPFCGLNEHAESKSEIAHPISLEPLQDVKVDFHADTIDTFLRVHELEKLGPPERRLKLKDHSFRIIENRGNKGGTLYRALSQAITTEEQDYPVIRQIIARYILMSWATFGKILVPAYRGLIPGFNPSDISEDLSIVQGAYLHASIDEEIEGTFVELMVAAELYRFNYTLLIVEKNETMIRVVNCQDEAIKADAKAKYFFLRSGENFSEWHWELLVPYSSDPMLLQIPSGTYTIDALNVYPFNKGHHHFLPRDTCPTYFTDFPRVFSLEDGNLYACLQTNETNIFCNLSILLYGSPNMARVIFDTTRHSLSSSPPIELYDKEGKSLKETGTTTRKIEISQLEPGTLDDISLLAKNLRFTYTVYAIDENVHFLKIDEIPKGHSEHSVDDKENDEKLTSKSNAKAEMKHFTFLTRSRKHYPMEWTILVQIDDSKLTKTIHHDDEILNENGWRIDYTNYTLTPIATPYTKKKSLFFGLKYRVLSKEALSSIRMLLRLNNSGDEMEENREEDDFEDEEIGFDVEEEDSSSNGSMLAGEEGDNHQIESENQPEITAVAPNNANEEITELPNDDKIKIKQIPSESAIKKKRRGFFAKGMLSLTKLVRNRSQPLKSNRVAPAPDPDPDLFH